MATLATAQPQKQRTGEFLFTPLLSGFGKYALYIGLTVIGLLYVFPFIWMVGSAFKTNQEFFALGISPFPAGEWQWGNFRAAWETAQF
ncbi:MAG: hypothetical protein HC828_21810, partial [Blastochloris sp.]|nr:hypothetical protein [Blastochloris sp.]